MLIAWAIMEPTRLMPDYECRISDGATFMIGLLSGLLPGLLLGIAEGLSGLSQRDATRTTLSGGLVGMIGGIVGMFFGNAVYATFERIGRSGGTPQFASFFLLVIGRSVGWAFLGGFIGLSQGLATLSTKKMINGGIGGVIGGGLGGCVFEILVWMNKGGAIAFEPPLIRFVAFAATGGAIGLFIGFIEEIAKKAWLVKLVGRNEGKEYEIYKPLTVLGRDELADIPVFGDSDVIEKHAAIMVQGSKHVIEDSGSFGGTTVNGNRISKEILKDGDLIQIGKTQFLFHDKATAGLGHNRVKEPGAGVSIPTSQHICPFCGSVKDASGNCQCSVIGQGGLSQQPAAFPQDPFQTIVQPPATSGQPTQVLNQAPQPAVPMPNNGGAPDRGARLVAVSGPYAGNTFVLKSGETQVGRDAAKDIPLPNDTTVSRNHARIVDEAATFVLYDLGSTNGTYVNGNKITRQELSVGDLVQIGSTKFRFEL